VALKKPSDFFGNTKKTPLDEVKEEYISASPEKIEQVSEAFDAFKANLNHIQSLSDFTSTFDSFKSNLEKVENVSAEINEIKSEIKDLIKKEDLDSAMMAQLLFVEKSISKIESKVSSINGKSVDDIREDFAKLSSTVNGFLSVDVPKYKKLIAESEVKTDSRFTTFKEGVEENLGTIRADVDKEVTTALAEVQSINENVVSELKEDFKTVTKDINKTVDYLIDEELPKYRKFFAETEVKTEEKINSAIDSYKSTIENLSERVKEFTEEEIPKYSSLLIEAKLKSEKEVKELEEEVLSRVKVLSEKVESLSEDVEQKTSERVDSLQDVVKEYKEEIESISKRYETLQKDFTGRVVHEDKKLSQYSKKLDKFSKRFSFIEETLTEDVRELKENLETNTSKFYTELKSEINGIGQNITQTVKDLEVNIVINETHLKKQNEYIGNIQEEVKEVLDKLQLDVLEKKNTQLVERINHIEEVFSKINEKTLLTEDNPTLPGDPSTNNSNDPLTPLDQKFVTLDQLQNHYRTFINRIQQQIATIGGGGAGVIHDLDDVTFDRTTGEGKLLIYDGAKWVGIASTALGGGGGAVGTAGTWAVGSAGIHTDKNVGIATTARSDYALYVEGDQYIDGNITVGGTITYEDVKNVDSLGIVTARTGVDVLAGGINVVGVSTISTGIGTVHIGIGTTALLVDGDARVTGILTVGRSSITIDGNTNRILIGDEDITISDSSITIGSNVTINASATGINSAPNVLYVAKDGNDSNNGASIDNAFLTIAGAVGAATSGTVVKVLSGNYVESNPIEVPAFVAVVGDDLRTVKVLPNTTTSDIFHVNKGCKLANMTFSGHVAPAAAVAFPSAGATNVGGGKWKGPYIQNCTSDTTTGTGIFIDGDKAVKTKSMNVDAFTQYNQGGVGVAITNEGYAQLVSVFTICCDKAITVHKGGQADLANSNCSFGTFGLVADGVGPQQYTGVVTASATAGQDNITINVGAVTTRPYDGQVVYFDQLYKSVESITITNGGSGYTSTPSVTVSSPSGPNGEVATAFAAIENGTVTEIDIISTGSQYTGTATITISAPDTGTTAAATANMADTYYTINSSTPITAGITTLTLAENLINTVGVASTAYFFQQSKIIASSHTFEYIGSGNDITTATPKRGGVGIQANEVVSQNGGKVIYTSTDQSGNFRIGDDLQINQNTGTISGRAFSKSLFSEMTPFILALS
jgi:predicted  nucleic acid-binding Zn-ribbon protein